MPDREEVDLSKIKTVPLGDRKNKVGPDDFATPGNSDSFKTFWRSMPNILAASDIKKVVSGVRQARENGKPVIWLMGAHVIKVGLSPIVIDLMERGIITAVGMNGAGSIHDTEVAMIGGTSEDVAEGIKDGTFGMARETSEFINGAVKKGAERGLGYGEALGRKILESDFPNTGISILAAAARLEIPATVHVAFGTDITHIHPNFDPAAVGEATHRDFRIMTAQIAKVGGGVIFVVGSSVILPLIVEKGLAVARNLGHDVENFMGVNLDFIRHYRPGLNPVKRAFELGGTGITITGHHELTVPMIYWALTSGADLD